VDPSVAVVSKLDRQGAERKLGYDDFDAGPLSEGWRFDRARPAYCLPFDSAGLKQALAAAKAFGEETTEQFPFPVECRLVAHLGHSPRVSECPLSGEEQTLSSCVLMAESANPAGGLWPLSGGNLPLGAGRH
jgi:hypothetical protein